jgi:NAD(P)-dependent dehydrogenase (short-subunit alcohol dehydrogenase family)
VAEKGGEVVCLNRKSQRVEDSTKKLLEAAPNGKFVNIECDLQDFASVQKAAEEVKSKYDSIYCLSCNAGIMMTPDAATKDGCDTQMQTNHLSHFILTAQLFPLLEKEANSGGDARVVFHSSGARDMTKKGLERQYFEKKGGNLGGDGNSMLFGGGKQRRYAQTKLANSVMTYAMHEKLQAKGSKVRIICCHPGGSATNLGDDLQLSFFERALYSLFVKFALQSAEDGTMGLLKGMMDPNAESGVLYGPAKSGLNGPAVPNPPKKYENDTETMKMLWDVSEETTGVKFDI